MKALKTLTFFTTLCLVMPTIAVEDPPKGSPPLLCAAGKVVVCSEAAVCLEGLPEDVDLPRFVTVDIAKRQISGAWPPGTEKISKIDSVQVFADRVIIQGVDIDVPWSATIDKEIGKLVVTQSRKHVSFTVFGACMPK